MSDGTEWEAPEGSWASSQAARNTMTSTKGRDTAPELAVRSEVHGRGLRYRVDTRPLEELRRRADLVFRGARVAVFVDGCFWHGCPEHHQEPETNSDFWQDKIAKNRDRDRDTDRRLRDAGWSVVRIWEHEDPETAADRVERAVRGTPDA